MVLPSRERRMITPNFPRVDRRQGGEKSLVAVLPYDLVSYEVELFDDHDHCVLVKCVSIPSRCAVDDSPDSPTEDEHAYGQTQSNQASATVRGIITTTYISARANPVDLPSVSSAWYKSSDEPSTASSCMQ